MSSDDGAVWKDLGETCPTCGYNGDHLVVDCSLYYCGRCKSPL